MLLTVKGDGIISGLCLDIDILLGDLPIPPPPNLALRLGLAERGGAFRTSVGSWYCRAKFHRLYEQLLNHVQLTSGVDCS